MSYSFIVKSVISLYKKLFCYPQWFIAIRRVKPETSLEIKFQDFSDFKIITPPKGHFYADPFLFKKDGKNFLFFEDYRFLQSKGVIAVAEIDSSGNLKKKKVVIEKKYHLSYPFLFEYDGTIYMLPETSSKHTIELYRAVDFPEIWELEKIIFKDIVAADTTIFKYNNKFWMFTHVLFPGNALHKELFLYYADSPLGEWTKHPGNPIVSDLRRARPAGNLFYSGETLIRPSQDCSLRYGHCLAINRIEVLDESDYKEDTIKVITPDWLEQNRCIHTYNTNEDYEAIDGNLIIKDYWKIVRNAAGYAYASLHNFLSKSKGSK